MTRRESSFWTLYVGGNNNGGGGGNYGGNNNGGGGGNYGGGGGGGGNNPAPAYGQRGAVSRNDAPVRISPISSLNPYQNRWQG